MKIRESPGEGRLRPAELMQNWHLISSCQSEYLAKVCDGEYSMMLGPWEYAAPLLSLQTLV